jgi:hypothetical protein
MARIEWVHFRLLNWSRWMLTQGMGPLGYAGVDLTDPTPSELAPYEQAPVPTNAIEASDTNEAVHKLPGELKATVLEHYTGKGTQADHVKRLVCSRATLYARIERAHRLLAEHFNARRDRRDAERERVERVIQANRPK